MVSKGYKKTEIGIIPEDWELCSLEHDFDFYQNNTYARDCMNDISGIVRNIHYGDVLIKYGAILDCNKERIPFINHGISVKTGNRAVQSGDIIMADTAEDETVGKAVEVVNVGSKTIVSGLHTFFIRPHADLFAQRYLGYFINSSVYHDQLLPHIVGTKVSSISKKSLNETFVLRPGLPEQRRIAEALTDIDTLIANLEKLIAKKKAVKQGAMQKLLTGKKRLPGFSGEWVEKKLIELANFYDNLRVPVTECKREVGTVPYYGANGIQGYVKGYTHDGEFVLIAEDGANSLSNYPIMYFNGKAWVNNHAHVIQGITGKASTRFLSYVLKTVDYFQILVGGTRAKLNGSVAKEIIIKVPFEVSEQTAIASVLSDMDSEILDLEEKLSKYRNIKTGMMQTLLTGKIRLTELDAPALSVVPPNVEEQRKQEAKGHNQPFDDAVAIAAIVNAFYSDKYPLGRKKVQKLLYLLRRRQDASTAAFKKKAAGPYADEVRYKGGEPIAKRNNYVTVNNSKQGSMFVIGKDIGKALDYVDKWDMQPEIDWLIEQFLHTKVDTLELLATIDMAMCDLENNGVTPSVDSVKKLIASDKEWKAKLKKTYFSDTDIGWAITECLGLFNSTGR